MEIDIRPIERNEASTIASLLKANKLPYEDLAESNVKLYAGYSESQLIASIGIEANGDTALLRSLAVADGHKNQKAGTKMVAYLLAQCATSGVKEVYLLTTTAAPFFGKLGFTETTRAAAPESIKQTKEFHSICPVSSTIRFKEL